MDKYRVKGKTTVMWVLQISFDNLVANIQKRMIVYTVENGHNEVPGQVYNILKSQRKYN